MTPEDGAEAIFRFSTSLLHAELRRRQEIEEPGREDEVAARPQCGSQERGSYNTGLHVFALFLILFLSVLACAFPIVVRRFPKFPVPHRVLFLSRHFGTGVLIATAFVHLLPTAFVSLTDPCLPPFWTEGYPAMAGFIAMLSVLVVVGIEMFFAIRGGGHNHAINFDELAPPPSKAPIVNGHAHSSSRHGLRISGNFRKFRSGSMGSVEARRDDVEGAQAYGERSPPASPRGSVEGLPDGNVDDFDPLHASGDPSKSGAYQHIPHDAQVPSNTAHTHPGTNTTPPPSDQKLLLQCLLLEAGILFHSIFIGMALSTAVGTPFIVLLIAISFHQTFEGLALGSRIAGIEHAFGKGSIKPWLMALAYGTTTPIGQAIGLGVHELYDPASEAGLLMVGIMNAISSGLLLFAGLVELLAEDFLSDGSYQSLRGRKRLEACGAVVGGAVLMALVGAWA